MSTRAEATREVAVITGGASGFGLALGGRCAARGMDVVLLDRDGSRAEREAAALAAEHRVDALGLGTDVGDGRAVNAAGRPWPTGSVEPTSSSRTSACSSSEPSSA